MTFNKKIKLIAVGLAALAIALTASLSVMATTETAYTLGDVNCDGSVDIRDVTVIQKVLAKIIDEPDGFLLTADADNNGVINIKDATIIQKYIAKIYSDLPVLNDTEPETEVVTTVTEPGSSDPKPTATVETVYPTSEKETNPSATQESETQETTEAPTQPVTDEWDPHIYQP